MAHDNFPPELIGLFSVLVTMKVKGFTNPWDLTLLYVIVGIYKDESEGKVDALIPLSP